MEPKIKGLMDEMGGLEHKVFPCHSQPKTEEEQHYGINGLDGEVARRA